MNNNKTFNPCDECGYSYSKQNQESDMCKICEFKAVLNVLSKKVDPLKQLKQTNADRIYSMTVEELAEFLSNEEVAGACILCSYDQTGKCRYDEEGEEIGTAENCKEGVLEWLQSEVEES